MVDVDGLIRNGVCMDNSACHTLHIRYGFLICWSRHVVCRKCLSYAIDAMTCTVPVFWSNVDHVIRHGYTIRSPSRTPTSTTLPTDTVKRLLYNGWLL